MRPDYLPLWERYRDSLTEKSRRDFSSKVQKWLEWVKDRPLDEKAVLDYLEHLRAGQYAAGTVKETFSKLQRFAKVNGIAWQFRRDQKPTVQERDVHNYALPVEDVKMMVDICRGLRDPVIKLQPQPCHTAYLCLSTVWWLRPGELQEMSSADIDFKNKQIYVATSKHGRERYHTIPDFLVPYLEPWGFSRPVTQSFIGGLFRDLADMIGFHVYGVGWHAIRRSAAKLGDAIGMSVPEGMIYGRWAGGQTPMFARYAMSKTVTREGATAGTGIEDARIDEKVYSLHPFVQMWR
jgi:integrase